MAGYRPRDRWRWLTLLEVELPSVPLLNVSLGSDELVAPVAVRWRPAACILAVRLPIHNPSGMAAELAGAPNAGQPTSEHRMLATLNQLVVSRHDGCVSGLKIEVAP